MKKILYVVAFIASLSFVSCGNQTNSNTEADSVAVDSVDTVIVDTVDTVMVDSVLGVCNE